MAQVIWSVRAVEHIQEIGTFIDKDSAFQARRFVQLIIKQTRQLKTYPRIGRMIPELCHDSYRELIVFSYRILYKIVDQKTVAVLAVVHGRRLFDPQWLE